MARNWQTKVAHACADVLIIVRERTLTEGWKALATPQLVGAPGARNALPGCACWLSGSATAGSNGHTRA